MLYRNIMAVIAMLLCFGCYTERNPRMATYYRYGEDGQLPIYELYVYVDDEPRISFVRYDSNADGVLDTSIEFDEISGEVLKVKQLDTSPDDKVYPADRQREFLAKRIDNAEEYFMEPKGAQAANKKAFATEEYRKALSTTE